MADYCCLTTTHTSPKITDVEKLKELLDKFCSELDVDIYDDELMIYGYCACSFYKKSIDEDGTDETDYNDDDNDEFFSEISKFFEDNEILVIKQIGIHINYYINIRICQAYRPFLFYLLTED